MPQECCQFFNQIEISITFAVTIVIYKSRNLIDTIFYETQGLGLNRITFFRVILRVSVDRSAIIKSKEDGETREISLSEIPGLDILHYDSKSLCKLLLFGFIE